MPSPTPSPLPGSADRATRRQPGVPGRGRIVTATPEARGMPVSGSTSEWGLVRFPAFGVERAVRARDDPGPHAGVEARGPVERAVRALDRDAGPVGDAGGCRVVRVEDDLGWLASARRPLPCSAPSSSTAPAGVERAPDRPLSACRAPRAVRRARPVPTATDRPAARARGPSRARSAVRCHGARQRRARRTRRGSRR